MKYKHVILSILFLAMGSTAVFAQEMRMRRDDAPQMDMMKRLNLSEEQQAQVGKLRTDFQKQQITIRAKVQLAQVELRELMRADKPDKAAIEKKIQETSQVQAQQRLARVNHLLAVRALLTPEQQKMAREGMSERFREGLNKRGFRKHMFQGRGFRGEMFERRFEGRMRGFENHMERDRDE
ncbi:MAG TPA: Spy/CpxP family protein refolding chaperone [Bacteroidota bacterium]